jgi:CDP-diacylglycerol--glycerol-3-phosphate 3-phosphatidyltransferase
MLPFLKMLPNILTGSRLFFATGFLVLLIMADCRNPQADDVHKLYWSFVLFVIAGVTDILDGPLARRLKVDSAFGRNFDPLVDKILIAGGFIVLAIIGKETTGLAWWMIAVILAREVMVTVLRSVTEARGRKFGATWAGKLKMFLQSFAIGTIIIYIAYHQGKAWAIVFRDITIWITVVFTALSAVIYLGRLKNSWKNEQR